MRIDTVFLHLVIHDPIAGLQVARGLEHIAASLDERVHEQFLFKAGDGIAEGEPRFGGGTFGGLERRRQVSGADDLVLAVLRGTLERACQLRDIPCLSSCPALQPEKLLQDL